MSQIANFEYNYNFFMHMLIATQLNDFFESSDELTLKIIQVI